MGIDLTEMDYVRGAIANAMAEGMALSDLWECAAHAESGEAFDLAVNLLAQMKGDHDDETTIHDSNSRT